MIGSDLLRFDKEQLYILFDLETEGLNLHHSRPWQCSYIIFQWDKILETHDDYIWWPDLNVSAEAARVTRFDYNHYKSKAVDAKKALLKFRSYLHNKKYRVMGQNIIGYDSMIEAVWARGVDEPVDYSWLERAIDTHCLAKAMKKGIDIPVDSLPEFLAFQFTMQDLVEKGLKTSLSTLGKEFRIDFDYTTLHNGANDTILNKLVWDQMKFKIKI